MHEKIKSLICFACLSSPFAPSFTDPVANRFARRVVHRHITAWGNTTHFLQKTYLIQTLALAE